MTTAFINELSKFHLRDLDRLVPGTRVIFGHVPPLTDPILNDFHEFVEGRIATVVNVDKVSVNDLHNTTHDEEWATTQKDMIFYQNDGSDYVHTQHATDSAVLPYHDSYYNDTNFIVVLSDLEEAGIEYSLDANSEYKGQLDEFNSQVIEYDDNLESFEYLDA